MNARTRRTKYNDDDFLPLDGDALPFKNDEDRSNSSRDPHPSTFRGTTITLSERETFARIFDDIVATSPETSKVRSLIELPSRYQDAGQR